MAPFHVGQKVVCVESGKTHCRTLNVVKDDVYIISRGTYQYKGVECVQLKGMEYVNWCADRFAPIEPRSVSIPESLKEQAEELVNVQETIFTPEKESA